MLSTYCTAVDAGLFVSVNGSVGLCCSGSESLGSLRQTSVQEIFKNSRFIEIKNNLKNNVTDPYCSGCDHIESIAPNSSQRFAFNNHFPITVDRQIKLADIRWSNVCNLTCRYCNTHDSSEWRKLHNLPIETVNRDYTESLFKEIEDNKDTIENLYLLGGEPLLQKHNIRLLSTINRNVKIDLLTNLSVRLDNNKIYEQLKLFPTVLWNLSFDNIGERFEYVRQGAKWKQFEENLQRICEDFGPHRVTFHPVYTIWNATCLEEYYEYADKKNFRINWQVALPKLDNQFGLATDTFITFGHNKRVIDRAIKEIEQLTITDSALQGILNKLRHDIEEPSKSQGFLNWTDRMEKFMPPSKSFVDLWPELNTLLKD